MNRYLSIDTLGVPVLRAASFVDWHDLFEPVWLAVAAGLGIAVAFSFVVLGTSQAAGPGVVFGLIAMVKK